MSEPHEPTPAFVPPPSAMGFGGVAPGGVAPPPTAAGFEGGFGTGEPACKKKKQPQRGKLTTFLLAGVIALALAGGTTMVVAGSQSVPQDAPLPAVADNRAPVDQPQVGADGIAPGDIEGVEGNNSGAVAVENADTGGGEDGWVSSNAAVPVTSMSVAGMEPMSVFVPEAKMYSLARGSDAFAQSKYEGMTSIAIPDNPHRSVWHSAGGAMAGTNTDGTPATEGTTFLGSHSGYAGQWGAYYHMAYLTGGETIWTKDAAGTLQRWQVDRVQYMPHTEFPQEYWDKGGVRRLVLTTCGGTFGADGIYNENVFVEAKPVELDGSTWHVTVEKEAAAKALKESDGVTIEMLAATP